MSQPGGRSDLRLLGYLFTISEPTINTSVSLQILPQAYTNQVLKTVVNPRAKAALAYDQLIHNSGPAGMTGLAILA